MTATNTGAAKYLIDTFGPHASGPVFVTSLANDNSEIKKYPPRQIIGSDPEEIAAFVKEWDVPGRAAYFCVSILKSGVGRRNKKNLAKLTGLHADIDFRHIAASEKDVLAALRKLRLKPNRINHSGHGLHAYWYFKQAIEATPEHIVRVEAALRRLCDVVAGDTQVCEVARLMRIPGSHNTKDGDWIKVKTIASRNGVYYTLKQLEAWLENAKPVLTRINGTPINDAVLGDKNVYEALGDAQIIKPPIDIDARFAAMQFHGAKDAAVHPTQRAASASLLSRGVPLEDVVAEVLERTWRAIGPTGLRWDWREEERKIRKKLCEPWLKDHPELAELKVTAEVQAETEQVKDAVTEPIDFWNRLNPPPFPRGLLPDVIEQFAIEESELMGADPSGLAMSALTVCAAAIPDYIQIQVKRHNASWRESARLWTALIADPSTKKSPIMLRATEPLKRIDTELWRTYSIELECYDALSREDRKGYEAPKQKRLRLDDVTIEAAQEVLKNSPNGVLCIQDELSGWFGNMDKYSGRGAAKDRAFWLQSFHGGSYAVNRIGRGAFMIENLSISLLGGIQPDRIRLVAADTIDDGLVQRLLPVILTPGTIDKDAPATQAGDRYDALVNRLHEMSCPPAPFQFDDDALVVRKKLAKKHLDLMACKIVNKKLAAHIGKYDGIFARLCLIWHCIEDSKGQTVTKRTAQRVADFMHRFLLPHAAAFYADMLELSDDHERLAKVAGFILAHKLTRVTNRDVQQGCFVMRGLKRQDIEGIFEQLDALGWVTRMPGPYWSKPPHWQVNPEVHRRFVERATREIAERAETREKLLGLQKGDET
jgi:hypothetical protein